MHKPTPRARRSAQLLQLLVAAALLTVLIGAYELWQHATTAPPPRAAAAAATASKPSPEHTTRTPTPAAAVAEAAAPPAAPRTACTDSCAQSRNGVCDEGRSPLPTPGSPSIEVLCDLGTDCTDCGAWGGHTWAAAHAGDWAGQAGPVAFIRAVHNTSIRVKLTATTPAFLMAITLATVSRCFNLCFNYYRVSCDYFEVQRERL